MFNKTKNILPVIILFLSVLCIYLSSLSNSYDFDSISLAQWAEGGIYFVPSQQFHLLNYFFNNIFYYLWKILGYSGSAILPIQVLDAIFGALSVCLFFFIINNLVRNKFVSFICTLGLGFSSEFWHYSTEAETHIISIFFLLLAIFFISRPDYNFSVRDIRKTAFCHGLAIFSSAAYFFFFPFFLIIIAFGDNSKQEKKNLLLKYLFYLIIFWLLPYLFIGAVLTIKKNAHYFYDTGLVKFIKRFGHGIIFWFKSHERFSFIKRDQVYFIAQNFTKMLFGYTQSPIPGLLLFFFSAAFIGINHHLARKEKRMMAFAFAGFVMFIVFISIFFIYEPFNTQRYTPLLIFFWIVVGICMYISLKIYPNKFLYILIAGLVFFNIYLNFTNRIYPLSIKEKNYYLMETAKISEYIGKDDLVLIIGKNPYGYPEPRVRYFDYFGEINFFELGYLNSRFYDSYKREGNRQELLGFLKQEINYFLDSGNNVWCLDVVINTPEKQKPLISSEELNYDDIVDFLKNQYKFKAEKNLEFKFFDKEILYKLTKN